MTLLLAVTAAALAGVELARWQHHHRRRHAARTHLGAELWARTTNGQWWRFDGHAFVEAPSGLHRIIEARVHIPDVDILAADIDDHLTQATSGSCYG